MSSEKKQDTHENGPVASAGGQSEGVVSLAGALRTRLSFQRRLGLRAYPASPALRRFLVGPEQLQQESAPAVIRPPVRAAPRPPVGATDSAAGLDRQRRDIEECTLCTLAATRQGFVCGAGGLSVRLMFVGDWSRQSGSFLAEQCFGPAEDTMLWNMVRAIGLTPADVYVTNAIKCCPPPGLVPGEENRNSCQTHLRREIDLVRPALICAMGEIATRSLLGQSGPVVRLRGRLHPYGGGGGQLSNIQVAVTYHPQFLLDHPDLKKAAWEDLQMVQRRLCGSGQPGG
ncbi:MAG: uracil-DNA glycosylase [Desulfobulbus sp.]|nr:uracil-DNA glycosylase [Desulfobulbus sp.]